MPRHWQARVYWRAAGELCPEKIEYDLFDLFSTYHELELEPAWLRLISVGYEPTQILSLMKLSQICCCCDVLYLFVPSSFCIFVWDPGGFPGIFPLGVDFNHEREREREDDDDDDDDDDVWSWQI